MAGETVQASIPPPLPPESAVDLTGLYQELDHTNQALGRSNSLPTLLPGASAVSVNFPIVETGSGRKLRELMENNGSRWRREAGTR